MSVKFTKGENWKCQKCGTVVQIIYDLPTPEEEVMAKILAIHKTKQIDCTAPNGFKQTDNHFKQTEIK